MSNQKIANAYKIVMDDLMANGPTLFKGEYDAKHGNDRFMYGISTVLEHIAYKVNDKCGDDFQELFISNMVKSEERANND